MHLLGNIVVCFSLIFMISESIRKNKFSIKSGKTVGNSQALIKTVAVESLIECAAACSSDLGCSYGVFRANAKTCWLYSANATVLSGSLTDAVLVKCTTGGELRMETGYYGSLGIANSDLDTIDIHYVLFDVKTCERFYLYFYQQTTLAFSVKLGIYESSIYLPNVDSQSVWHYSPLYNYTSYKSFWIRWSNTTVEVGTGHIVGTERFLHSTTADMPTIDKIKIWSWFQGTTYWVFASQGDRCD